LIQIKVIEYTKGVADLNENIQKSKPKRQMINCVNEDDEQGHNANNAMMAIIIW